MALTRIGSIALNAGDSTLTCSVTDTTANKMYLAGGHSKIIKCSVGGTFARDGELSLASITAVKDLCIDITGGYLYAWAETASLEIFIVKITLSTFTEASRQSFGNAFSTAYGYYLEYSTSQDCLILFKNNSSSFATIYKVNKATLVTITSTGGFLGFELIIINDTSTSLYTVANYILSKGFIIKSYRLSDLGLIGTQYTDSISWASILTKKVVGDYLFLNLTAYGSGYLGVSAFLTSNFAKTQIDIPDSPEIHLGVYQSSFFYVITKQAPGKVHRIDIPTLKVVGSLTLTAGDTNPITVGSQNVTSPFYLYILDATSPHDLIKVDIDLDVASPGTLTYSCLASEGSAKLLFTDAVGGIDIRTIYESADGLTGWSTTGTTPGTNSSYGVTVQDETTKYYKYKNTYKSIDSTESSIISVICSWHPWPPEKPTWLRAVKSTNLLDNIITWYYNIYDNCGNIRNYIDGFKIYRKASTDSIYTLLATITNTATRTYTDAAVGGVVYTYKLVAYNSHRDSGQTDAITVDLGTPTNFFDGKYIFDGTIDFSGGGIITTNFFNGEYIFDGTINFSGN